MIRTLNLVLLILLLFSPVLLAKSKTKTRHRAMFKDHTHLYYHESRLHRHHVKVVARRRR